MLVRRTFRRSNGITIAITAFAIACANKPDSSTIDTKDTVPTGGGGTGGQQQQGAGGGTLPFGSGGGSGSGGGGGSTTSGGGTSNGEGGPSGGSTSSGADAAVSPCGDSIVGLGKCGTQTISAQIRHPQMLIVLDKSGSMTDKPSGFDVSIWDGVTTALSTSLEAAKSRVAFGLEMYPTSSKPGGVIPVDCQDKCCEMPTTPDIAVPIEAGETAVPKIVATLKATTPSGGTPTALALEHAYEYFTTGAGASLQGEKFVMLATDGGPNCNTALTCPATSCTLNLEGVCPGSGVNCCDSYGQACVDDVATNTQIQALRDAGINTFVVGIPGSEAYSHYLDQFATTGNQVNPNAPPSYYRVDVSAGVAGLTAVFNAITTQLVTSCDITLASPPRDKDKVNVAINCGVVPSSGTTGTDGWVLDTSVAPATITLQGNLCRWVQQQGADRIDVVFGCPTIR